MESASEAPGTMGAEEATGDPPAPLSSAAPPPPPPASAPASSSASTKRRWSPCTWRYAIEDAQADLPSRPRTTAPLAAASVTPSSRTLHSSPLQQPIRAKPPCYNPLYGKAAEEPHRISSYSPRTQSSVEPRLRSLPSVSKSRTGEVYSKSHHNLHASRARASEEDEEEDEEGEQDDQDDDHDEGLPVFDEEYFKRRRREMSPSELYFCAICSAKAAETKGTPCHYDNS